MTKLEALQMVRSAQQHIFGNIIIIGRHPRIQRKATEAAYTCLLNAERGLEFEAMFESKEHFFQMVAENKTTFYKQAEHE